MPSVTLHAAAYSASTPPGIRPCSAASRKPAERRPAAQLEAFAGLGVHRAAGGRAPVGGGPGREDRFGKLSARVDTLETARNAHVNAPALHR